MSTVYRIPKFRLRVSPRYGGDLQELPLQDRPPGNRINGWYIDRFPIGGVAFPESPQAAIRRYYGRISGKDYDEPQDLLRYHVLIDYDIQTDPEGEPTWKTVFWGVVIGKRDISQPGADKPQGYIEYSIASGIHSLKEMKVNRHLWYISTLSGPSYGHPGYNATDERSLLLGNKSTKFDNGNGDAAFAPMSSIDSDIWTDAECVQNALLYAEQEMDGSDRRIPWTVTGSLDLLSGSRHIPIEKQDTVWTMLQKMQTQGLDAVIVSEFAQDVETWDDLQPTLRLYPQRHDSIVYDDPISGDEVTLLGAEDAGTSIDLDFVGKKIISSDGFTVADVASTQYDAVRTMGERIEVVATVAMERLWTDAQRAAYLASDIGPLSDDIRYANAFALVTPEPAVTGTFTAIDANQTTGSNFAVIMHGNGLLEIDNDASGIAFEIADDLPFRPLNNYWDSPTITPIDGADDVPQGSASLPWQFWERDSEADPITYESLNRTTDPAMARDGDNGRAIRFSPGRSLRYFEQFAASGNLDGVGNIYGTFSFIMPNRMQFETGDFSGNVKDLHIDGPKLILAHNGAVIFSDDDSEPVTPSVGPVVIPGSIRNFYRLRDDRSQLAAIHAQAVDRFTNPRKTIEFTIQGVFPLSPQLPITQMRSGQLIHQLSYSGREDILDTTITSMMWMQDGYRTTVKTEFFSRFWR